MSIPGCSNEAAFSAAHRFRASGGSSAPADLLARPRSHQAVRETVRAKKRVTKAIAVATKEVVATRRSAVRHGALPRTLEEPQERRRARARDGKATGSRAAGKPTPLAVNDPLAFIRFIAAHPLGEQVEGEVEGYTSHGAVVRVGEMRCHVPLANLGDPAPRSARQVLKSATNAECSC